METAKNRSKSDGSALILTIVLTSLLAIVGAMFIIASRVDRISSSSVMDSRDMDSAVQTVIGKLSQVLAEDVPSIAGEYHDYPGENDWWLASLEPYDRDQSGVYMWGQISDATGYLHIEGFPTNDVFAIHVPEYPEIALNAQGKLEDQTADADGDGVADAKWIELEGIGSSRGLPVYAAIRVVDNGGMLNVNTAYKFDPTETQLNRIDGSSQTQINLEALSDRGSNSNAADKLQEIRSGDESPDLETYKAKVIWEYGEPNGSYTPFDISEELALRNRYIIKLEDIETRIEDTDPCGLDFWKEAYDGSKIGTLHTPLNSDTRPESVPADWFYRVNYSSPDEMDYDYRHISTIYNMDRVVDPAGDGMINVNSENLGLVAQELYESKLVGQLLENSTYFQQLANKNEKYEEFAQIIANIADYADNDSFVTVVEDVTGGVDKYHYGFETPCIYISEILAYYENITSEQPPVGEEPAEDVINRSFAVELFAYPPAGTIDSTRWRLNFGFGLTEILLPDDKIFSERGDSFFVMLFENPSDSHFDNLVKYIDTPEDGATNVDPGVILTWPALGLTNESYILYLDTNKTPVEEGTGGINLSDGEYDPEPDLSGGTGPGSGATYYWRVDYDYVDSFGESQVQEGQVMSLTTWDSAPPDHKIDIDLYDPTDQISSINSIQLERKVDIPGGGDEWIVVDAIKGINNNIFTVHDDPISNLSSEQRDIEPSRVIKRRWSTSRESATPGYSPNLLIKNNITLGEFQGNPLPIQTRPYSKEGNTGFVNVGEIGNVFRKSTYMQHDQDEENAAINDNSQEYEVRVNLADPDVQKLFQYFTAIYPTSENETRVKGRININTAPWYVIAQLPWVSERDISLSSDKYELAKAIVAYRDKLTEPVDYEGEFGRWNRIGSVIGPEISLLSQGDIREDKGFESIGELALVVNNSDAEASIRYYSDAIGSDDQAGFPDLSIDGRTKRDGAENDFEERNLLFYRMSDLVTVRSDVFTAYILVRIGTDGPQRRFIAVLDRSKVGKGADRVKVVSLHSVPDPR
ncbi:MAG: hypothetical protein ACYTE8_06075 [Planctomycetota bacterium]|jgi:hypothetical protein